MSLSGFSTQSYCQYKETTSNFKQSPKQMQIDINDGSLEEITYHEQGVEQSTFLTQSERETQSHFSSISQIQHNNNTLANKVDQLQRDVESKSFQLFLWKSRYEEEAKNSIRQKAEYEFSLYSFRESKNQGSVLDNCGENLNELELQQKIDYLQRRLSDYELDRINQLQSLGEKLKLQYESQIENIKIGFETQIQCLNAYVERLKSILEIKNEEIAKLIEQKQYFRQIDKGENEQLTQIIQSLQQKQFESRSSNQEGLKKEKVYWERIIEYLQKELELEKFYKLQAQEQNELLKQELQWKETERSILKKTFESNIKSLIQDYHQKISPSSNDVQQNSDVVSINESKYSNNMKSQSNYDQQEDTFFLQQRAQSQRVTQCIARPSQCQTISQEIRTYISKQRNGDSN